MFITPTSSHYLLALNHFGKIGPIGIKQLESKFTSLGQVFLASAAHLRQAGWKEPLAHQFVNWRKTWDERPIINELKSNKIKYRSWHDVDYPDWLKEIPDPPPVIYFSGQLNGSVRRNLAVVGPRKPDRYAHQLVNHLLPEIIGQGINIVSGLAYGVDSLAHQSALDNQGQTLAVLGSGLLNIYPRSNLLLAKRISQSAGAVISEFPPHCPPLKNNFPRRNRLISGLARATLIIEAKSSSGSLITARHALEQGRDVLAVPGNIFSQNCQGSNQLIASGAVVVQSSQDILDLYELFN